MPPPNDVLDNVERVVAKQSHGNGHQYQVKYAGGNVLAWVAASRVKARYPALVEAFEQGGAAIAPPANAGGADLAAQVAQLQQSLRDQQDLLAAALKAAGGSSGSSSSSSAQSTSRFAKKEPRTQDLREYEGAQGSKLDDWIQELTLATELYELNDREAVKFAASRLRGAALQWWLALDAPGKAALDSASTLAAALRTRFQPITAARVARQQLDGLRQGSRGINEYIADFQRLRAQLPSMAEEDALYAFERGVNPAIALEMRKAGTQRVAEAIALAARIGGLAAATSSSSSPPTRGSAHQMEIDSGDGALEDRVAKAVLNMMQSQASGGSQGAPGPSGLGAKTQTQRGYAQARSGCGGSQGFRGERSGGRNAGEAPHQPKIPGVSPEVVAQRRAANQCYRCGDASHTRFECMNATKPLN
jgi:hypothetical protein